MTAPKPPMYYDYYGFPPAAYELRWPAATDLALVRQVRDLLGAAGFATSEDPERGWDHGTFVPLMVTYPEAEIPVVQLSLIASLDPAEHLRLGRALAPLRDDGVFLIGSGMTFHNLRTFRDPRSHPIAETFDAWLRDTMTRPAAERDRGLVEWAQAPMARLAHPREEHLLPLHVIAGAGGDDPATLAYHGTFMGLRMSAYQYG
jgi:aromatic ring-opening dioxygenase catalytic subunit (LigB family)